MGDERKTRRKTNNIENPRGDISEELRSILEQGASEGAIEAGMDAAIEERVIVTREEILRITKKKGSKRPKDKSTK